MTKYVNEGDLEPDILQLTEWPILLHVHSRRARNDEGSDSRPAKHQRRPKDVAGQLPVQEQHIEGVYSHNLFQESVLSHAGMVY